MDRLQRKLEAAGIRVWRDTLDLWPGEDWREKIRRAITADALVFIACFSRNSLARTRSYQNEELTLAIKQLRLRRPDVPWLIPVRLDDCVIPDRDIGAGRTLASIQRADLFGYGYDVAVTRLATVILRILGTAATGTSGGGRPRFRTAFLAAALLAALGAGLVLLFRGGSFTPLSCAAQPAGPATPVKLRTITTGSASGDFVGATFGPDCAVVATVGNGTAQVWDLAANRQIASLPADPGEGNYAFGTAFTPDGKTLAVAAGNGITSLWDVADGQLITTLSSDSGGGTYSVAISPDGKVLFTGGSTGVIRSWDVVTHRPAGTINTGDPVGAMALSPDGRILAVGGADGTDRIYDTASRRQIRSIPGGEGHIYSAALGPDNRTLAVGTYDGVLQWWDAVTGRLIAGRSTGRGSVTAVRFSHDGRFVAASGDGVVQLWDARTHRLIFTLPAGTYGNFAQGLAFSNNDAVLAVGYQGTLQLWDVAGISHLAT